MTAVPFKRGHFTLGELCSYHTLNSWNGLAIANVFDISEGVGLNKRILNNEIVRSIMGAVCYYDEYSSILFAV